MDTQQTFDFQGVVPALCSPVIKYAGGKGWLTRILALRLHAHLVKVGGIYVEPFAGSLALGFSVGWTDSAYGDTNPDVANLYRALAADASVVADAVDVMREISGEDIYYVVRESVWPRNRDKLTPAEWASRTIWLNKNCFNGLMRYSRDGRFNVPWGKREAIVLPSRDHLERVGRILIKATIWQADFASLLSDVVVGRDPMKIAVYLDPPYGAKLKDVSNRGAKDRGGPSDSVFTGYAGSFGWEDQIRLAECARGLAGSGALVIASNSWTDEICDLYRDKFVLFQVGVRHNVGATGARRGRRAEMLAVSEAHASVVESIPAKITRRK